MIDLLKITKLKEALSDYLKIKLELFKVDMTQHMSNILAQVIAYAVILLISSMVVFFVSMGLGYLINEQLESRFLGFMIVAGGYFLILLVVLFLLKSGRLKVFFEEKMLETIEKSARNPDKEEESNEE